MGKAGVEDAVPIKPLKRATDFSPWREPWESNAIRENEPRQR
jgi:hypothetical protein